MHPCHSTTTTRGKIQLCSRRACIPFFCRTLVPLLHIFVAEDASLLFMTDGVGAPGNECGLRRQDSGRLGRVEEVEGPNLSVAFPGARSQNTSRMMNAWPSFLIIRCFSSDAGIHEASQYRDSWPQDAREQHYPLFGAGKI